MNNYVIVWSYIEMYYFVYKSLSDFEPLVTFFMKKYFH